MNPNINLLQIVAIRGRKGETIELSESAEKGCLLFLIPKIGGSYLNPIT